ncbi:IS66 family transposase [Escherichia sp. TWPC-MK]
MVTHCQYTGGDIEQDRRFIKKRIRNMHDGWKSYDAYTNCRHVLCNAHLLRDLQGIIDSTGQKWSKSIWLPSINPY